jgi:hypothetical protein
MRKVPWSQGKTQGISSIQPLFTKIRLENACESSGFAANSLRGRAGNYFAHAGNLFRLLGRSREFGAKPIRSPGRIRLCKKIIYIIVSIIDGERGATGRELTAWRPSILHMKSEWKER